MQDTIELIRVSKNEELGFIDRVRKVVEWRDVISIEEAGQDVTSEIDQSNLIIITLSYTEIVIEGSYKLLKTKWLKFRKEAREEDNKLDNIRNKN